MRRMMHRRQQGFMAIVLVVFLVVFVVIAASIVSMTTSGARGAADHVTASSALFMAESGIEWAALELFDTEDPVNDCNELENHPALPVGVNDAGSFDITESFYDEGCRLTVRGYVAQSQRVLKGRIPDSVLDGDTGGGDDMFDDSEEKFGNSCNSPNVTCSDGALTFNRPGNGGGNPPTDADGDALISDSFESGDRVYFTANIEWDADPSGNFLEVELRNNIASCDLMLPSLSSSAECTDTASELNDLFDIVLFLGDDFSPQDVNTVRLRLDWAPNSSNHVTLTNGCIGREAHCASEGGDDPVDDGTWDEDP